MPRQKRGPESSPIKLKKCFIVYEDIFNHRQLSCRERARPECRPRQVFFAARGETHCKFASLRIQKCFAGTGLRGQGLALAPRVLAKAPLLRRKEETIEFCGFIRRWATLARGEIRPLPSLRVPTRPSLP
ncbi:hypothetical protein H6P81_020249 [Aristolochia fimbriata]|uniref:Uncharacterized protein n=1 Tax=Aristolochia fimbriata TaxID=158543 RepID=A0AAV7DV21_ARIFI|nr:hypothetical protein H6P81_020249 [Aristolochia fimbriata]